MWRRATHPRATFTRTHSRTSYTIRTRSRNSRQERHFCREPRRAWARAAYLARTGRPGLDRHKPAPSGERPLGFPLAPDALSLSMPVATRTFFITHRCAFFLGKALPCFPAWRGHGRDERRILPTVPLETRHEQHVPIDRHAPPSAFVNE